MGTVVTAKFSMGDEHWKSSLYGIMQVPRVCPQILYAGFSTVAVVETVRSSKGITIRQMLVGYSDFRTMQVFIPLHIHRRCPWLAR